ncbi:hypothetical protein M089_5813 [Bacteroides ovatus str. 3725 D9 iii]|jgi:hypothetical protein|nr:hypothetical protein BSCG_01657 [Bacteroides sp. 2_2_4]EXY32111.1 hypothetical protein M080_5599 [Bacteroides fragilis str. 3397 T10]KDS14311.1 hypothetical protein M089_5813 [Bacteroides ovatus str. 3725 D9 iii]KDS18580.1 hypothetical protein M088_0105 [Bacteroides ovatus str. 3725 D1 iv]KDS20035.1 hypothetical protein M082_2053 [Bacteroides fragilis str. 3725 D9 ii]KXT48198.1 hypothetical protein HMPREF2532_01772 [Bacteroides ovatus]
MLAEVSGCKPIRRILTDIDRLTNGLPQNHFSGSPSFIKLENREYDTVYS